MSGKRYSEEHIVRILGEIEGGRTVAATARECGVSETTIYRWRKKFGGMDLSEVRWLKERKAENAPLRRIGVMQPRVEPMQFPIGNARSRQRLPIPQTQDLRVSSA